MTVEEIKKEVDFVILDSRTLPVARNRVVRVFWTNLRKNKRRYPHGFTKEEVLEVFRYIATKNLKEYPHLYWKKPLTTSEVRKEYNEKKQNPVWKLHIDARDCYICDYPADVRHHVLPINHGGKNTYKNIRALCDPCHAEIHPWLK